MSDEMTLEERQALAIQALIKLHRAEERAHGHHRICVDCGNPAQPSNGCPTHRAMMAELVTLKRLAQQLVAAAGGAA